MFLSKKKSSFILLLSAVVLLFSSDNHEWKLKKNSNGIAVYSRGVTTSAFKELRSVFQLHTSLSSIVALLDDRDAFPEWVYKCGNSHIIKRYTTTETVCYQNVLAPWPVDNRDFVILVKTVQDEKTKVVCQTAQCLPDFIPKVKDCVRITEFKAKWIFTPINKNLVNVDYELLVNPGGNIPAWLVNLAAVDGPYETAFNMQKIIMKEKYQKAKIDFIKETE